MFLSLRSRRIKGWGWGRRKSIQAKDNSGAERVLFCPNSLPPPVPPPLYTPATQANLSGSINTQEKDRRTKFIRTKYTILISTMHKNPLPFRNIKEVKNITSERTIFINNAWPKNGRRPIRDHKRAYALA